MKRHFFLTLIGLAAIGTGVNAQTTTHLNAPVGIGISTAVGNLHLHQATQDEENPGHEPLSITELVGNYTNTLHLTNPQTGTTATDGFVISQSNALTTLRQYENALLNIYGTNGTGITVGTTGMVGVKTAPVSGYALKVGGNTNVTGNMVAGGNITAANATFSGVLNPTGRANLGSGIVCYPEGILQAVDGYFNGTLNTTGTLQAADGYFNGTVKAKSVWVTLDGWSDFVFDEGYRLPGLMELEGYIRANRHLPDVPSAAEVENNGVDLGQMNARLLQKIEELTLYVIDLQKQIDELKQEKE